MPENPHGDPRSITLADLQGAADAAGISLIEATGNILDTVGWILDADDDCPECGVLKGAAPQRYVLGVAYQPGPDPRIARGQDGGRDYFTEAELEKAAWQYLKHGPRVGLFHVDGTDGSNGSQAAAEVVESYIWRGDPWDLGDGTTVTKGTWLVGMILSPAAWELYESGRLSGLSPQGTARRRRPAAPASA